MTVAGWQLLVQFADGLTNWLPLSEVKNGNPVEVADYAMSNHLIEEPAFKWWVPHVLRKWDRIISKVTRKYWQMTHTFGVHLPKSTAKALAINRENGNTLWEDALKKEMSKAKIAYTLIEGCTPKQVRANQVDALLRLPRNKVPHHF